MFSNLSLTDSPSSSRVIRFGNTINSLGSHTTNNQEPTSRFEIQLITLRAVWRRPPPLLLDHDPVVDRMWLSPLIIAEASCFVVVAAAAVATAVVAVVRYCLEGKRQSRCLTIRGRPTGVTTAVEKDDDVGLVKMINADSVVAATRRISFRLLFFV
jgi:hypothetical protein